MQEHPLTRWKALVRDKNVEVLDDLLDEQVVYLSPVLQHPQIGKSAARLHLSVTVKLFFTPEFRYVREIVDGQAAVLEFVTRFQNIALRGADILSWNAEGRITEFKALIGPLAEANLVKEQVLKMFAGAKRGEA